MKITPEAAASYSGAAASVAAGFTLQDFGIWVGIVTALATCIAHIYFASKRAALDEKVALATLESHK